MPAMDLYDMLFPPGYPKIVHEDNQAMIHVVTTGRNPTMRYLHRTHRVSVSWLHEVCKRDDVVLMYEDSAKMAADIYTKGFTDKAKWEQVCGLINVIDPKFLRDKNYVLLNCVHAPPSDGGFLSWLKLRKAFLARLVGTKMRTGVPSVWLRRPNSSVPPNLSATPKFGCSGLHGCCKMVLG